MYSYIATVNTGTQPEVLSLQEGKDHLVITHSYQDALIQSYIDAAITDAENYTSRSLKIYDVTATGKAWEQDLYLQQTPYLSGLVIKYRDSNNVEQTLSDTLYVVEHYNGEPVIVFHSFSTLPDLYDRNDAVTITYTSGYVNTDAIPEPFAQFARLFLGYAYEKRSDSVDSMPRFMYSLIRPYKKWD